MENDDALPHKILAKSGNPRRSYCELTLSTGRHSSYYIVISACWTTHDAALVVQKWCKNLHFVVVELLHLYVVDLIDAMSTTFQAHAP